MKRGFVRIIAGKWRSRRLTIPEMTDLRPTPDRVRETLFNWLNPHLHHAVCLDAFAGTGILGFEALSRGAASVIFIDHSATVVALLQKELMEFEVTEKAKCYQVNMPNIFPNHSQKFDIVFLDPPYTKNLLIPTCFFLEEQDYLNEKALIYLEAGEEITASMLPPHWHIVKAARAGQVYYYLASRH